jgi:hypothetical protein
MPPVREIQAALLQPGGGSVRAAQSKVVRRRRPCFFFLSRNHTLKRTQAFLSRFLKG